ncbi:MAG TPA: hypothetical protein VFB45_06515 [Pseudolabrys sp.]|nr:hypothetical protein [Pseudolabrys sp.]
MAQHEPNTGFFGLILGGIVAAAALLFILTGGQLGGKKTVSSDKDMPPLASQTAPEQK